MVHKSRRPRKTKPTPPKEHQWKKGQSGNPLGARLHNPETKALKNLTKQELIDIGNLIVKGDIESLTAIRDSVKTGGKGVSVLSVWIASVAMRSIESGDMHALDILLNRLIGKVKDDVTLTSFSHNMPQVVVTLPSNGREAKEE